VASLRLKFKDDTVELGPANAGATKQVENTVSNLLDSGREVPGSLHSCILPS